MNLQIGQGRCFVAGCKAVIKIHRIDAHLGVLALGWALVDRKKGLYCCPRHNPARKEFVSHASK